MSFLTNFAGVEPISRPTITVLGFCDLQTTLEDLSPDMLRRPETGFVVQIIAETLWPYIFKQHPMKQNCHHRTC